MRPPAIERFTSISNLIRPTVQGWTLYDELDPNAEEIALQKKSIAVGFISSLFNYTNSFEELREFYRQQRRKERLSFDQKSIIYTSYYNLANQVKIIHRLAKSYIWVMYVIMLLINVLFCAMYLQEIAYNGQFPCSEQHKCGNVTMPSWFIVNRVSGFAQFLVLLSFLKFVLIFVTGIVFADSLKFYFNNINVWLDIIIVLPFLVLVPFTNSQFYYVPYFLHCFLLIPYLKLLLLYKRQWSQVRFNQFTEKLIILVAYIWTLIYFGVATFNFFETRFKDFKDTAAEQLSLFDTFYFIVITFLTVGYGDIAPKTVAGKFIIIVLIFAAITILPGLITDVQQAVANNRKGGGIYSPSRRLKFVVIAGEFNRGLRVVEIIDSLMRNDETKSLKFVVLYRGTLSDDLINTLSQVRYRQKIEFYAGSGFELEDLYRVSLRTASAVFLLANPYVTSRFFEDEQNTIRASAFHNYAPETPLFLETLRPEAALIQHDFTTRVMCVEEFKQKFLASNCLYRGTGTLLINILRGVKSHELYDLPWHAQYGHGSEDIIYRLQMPPCFVGIPFTDASLYIFRHFQAILFAVQKYKPELGSYEVILNPGANYSLGEQDYMVLIAQNREDMDELAALTREAFMKTSAEILAEKKNPNPVGPLKMPPFPINKNISVEKYKIAKPAVGLNVRLPFCILLDTPPETPESILIQGQCTLENHVLICTENIRVFRFLCTMRSASLKESEIIPIVIAAPELPPDEQLMIYKDFPHVYFIKGEPQKLSTLQRANYLKTSRIVLMDLHRESDDACELSGGLDDIRTITLANLLTKIFHEHGKENNLLLDMRSRNSIRFLRPTNGHSTKAGFFASGTNDDAYYSPMFASGSVISSIMLESMLAASYHEPTLIDVYNAFCGVHYEKVYDDTNDLSKSKSSFFTVLLPSEFVGKTFGELYENFTRHRGAIPVGLLRNEISQAHKNKMPFVVSNPPWSWLLRQQDHVYVLAPKSITCE